MKKTLFLFALLVLMVAGCKNKKEEIPVVPEQVNIQLTAYSNDFEVYAEAKPFFVGRTSNVLSHFSHLPDFHALMKGSVTIRLLIEGSEVTQLLDKPTRKGIYSFDIKPTIAGTGKIVYDINIEGAAYQVVVPDIVVYSDSVSEKDLTKARNDFDNANTIFENLNKNFSAAGQSVSSPISGFVKQVFVHNGQFIEAGQPIASVSQNKTLLISADIQQKYAGILGSIISANIRTLHDDKTYTLKELNGRVLSFGRAANTDNYLVSLSIQIDNTGCFIPGGFVELYLKTQTVADAIKVPNNAIMEDQGNFFLYIQIHPELFEKRSVKIGATDGIRTEIKSGALITDRVITQGAILVKLAQATGTLDAHSGHNH